MSEHTILALCTRSQQISLEKGWLNPDGSDPRPFWTVAALFHSELSEALEDFRGNRKLNETYFEVNWEGQKKLLSEAEYVEYSKQRPGANAKPCGIPVEFADYVIRVAQWAGSNGHSERINGELGRTTLYSVGGLDKCVAELHLLVSKAYESSRSGDMGCAVDILGESLEYLFYMCNLWGVDLWAAIDLKEAYNMTRPHRHGGKKI